MARKIVKRLISMALAAVILFTPGCGNSNGGNLPSAENEKKNEQGSGDSDIVMRRKKLTCQIIWRMSGK